MRLGAALQLVSPVDSGQTMTALPRLSVVAGTSYGHVTVCLFTSLAPPKEEKRLIWLVGLRAGDPLSPSWFLFSRS